MSERGEGVMGNREVPRIEIPNASVDDSDACGRARKGKEGGTRGKPGFPRAMEPKAEEALA